MLEFRVLEKNFLSVLRDLIEEAERRVYVMTYLATLTGLTEPIYYAIARKVSQGVKAKVLLNMVSDEARKFNEPTVRFLKSIGVPTYLMTKRFTHAKVYVIDDNVVIGSHNLSAATATSHVELSVLIRDKGLADAMEEVIRRVLNEDYTPVKFESSVGGKKYSVLYNTQVLQVLHVLSELAVKRIKLMTYVATLSRTMKNYYRLLTRKVGEGVDVLVVLNGNKPVVRYNEKVYDYLRAHGVPSLLTKQFIHTKLYVIDDAVIVGSHNLTSASIAGRFEIDLVIYDANVANAFDYFITLVERKEKSLSG